MSLTCTMVSRKRTLLVTVMEVMLLLLQEELLELEQMPVQHLHNSEGKLLKKPNFIQNVKLSLPLFYLFLFPILLCFIFKTIFICLYLDNGGNHEL